jgi:hypothetical protein
MCLPTHADERRWTSPILHRTPMLHRTREQHAALSEATADESDVNSGRVECVLMLLGSNVCWHPMRPHSVSALDASTQSNNMHPHEAP